LVALFGFLCVVVFFWSIMKKPKKRKAGRTPARAASFAAPSDTSRYLTPRSSLPDAEPRARPELLHSQMNGMTYDGRRRQSSGQLPGRWIPPGTAVTVAGLTITGGMIYVGNVLPARYGKTDNCLIDPTLNVASAASHGQARTMQYWPSYAGISPGERRTYLEWLADGRSDPSADIGYVFLFFYGLERRFFVDNGREEAAALIAEVERLLSIYGDNHSFNGYARRFIDTAKLFVDGASSCELSPDLRNGYEIPLGVKIHLGRKIAAGENFDAEDALMWVLALPDTYARTAVYRCFEELKALWRLRFDERYSEGMKVRTPKARIKAVYQPASACFEATLSIDDLPDISTVNAPTAGLRDLLVACTDELDAYSRFVGRRPDSKSSPEALLLLPAALGDTVAGSSLQALKDGLDARFGDDEVTIIALADLTALLGVATPETDRLAPAAGRQLGAMLDRLDVGYEPDRRYGPLSPAADGQVALFRAKSGAPIDPDRPVHIAARTLVEVSVLATLSDGVVAPAEIKAIGDELEAIAGLNAEERLRLFALALVLLKDPPKQQAAMTRLAKLSGSERKLVTQSAISAVLADGRVTAEEIRFLERLHKAMGLPQEDVYAALHRGGTRSDEPTPVSVERWTPGQAIPAEPPPEKVVVGFDAERLERIRRETSAVSQLLSGIFVDEEPPQASQASQANPSESHSAFPGLDGPHAELLATVLASGACERGAFEDAARSLRLFPDGAMETINEWGFETYDEAVLEGDETIVPVEHLRERLQQVGQAL
jgi:hypothetical protein